jgi:hypothetical protein
MIASHVTYTSKRRTRSQTNLSSSFPTPPPPKNKKGRKQADLQARRGFNQRDLSEDVSRRKYSVVIHARGKRVR